MRRLLPLLAISALLGAPRLSAQSPSVFAPYARLGGELERAEHVRGLRDSLPQLERLIRSAGTRFSAAYAGRDTVLLLHPDLFFTAHSAHPWQGNDGALRAGVGRNLLVTAGLAFQSKYVSATLLPQLLYEANGRFQTIPYPQGNTPRRSVWANPFYPPGNSMDYPLRFGTEPRSRFEVQGRVALTLRPSIRVGIGREERWWGPGVQNALVLSNNAPAFDQLFVESAAPIQTRVGSFSYAYVLGRLEESAFFDENPDNDQRSLSAAIVAWDPSPRFPLLPTLGITRAVINRRAPGLASAFDVLGDAGRPWTTPADSARGLDQITGLFARWHAPQQGAAAWVEWVRYEQPGSLRDFLEQPGHGQGYTLGVEQARPLARGTLHLATEFTYAEPSPSIRVRNVETSYTGQGSPQGWTHDGQMLGPWIGPGASSQWARADYWAADWRAGVTLGRLRRDANVRFLNLPNLSREDVQLYVGLRYARTWRGMDWQLEYTEGARLNHLYQSFLVPGSTGGETTGVDLLNRSLGLTISPPLPRPHR